MFAAHSLCCRMEIQIQNTKYDTDKNTDTKELLQFLNCLLKIRKCLQLTLSAAGWKYENGILRGCSDKCKICREMQQNIKALEKEIEIKDMTKY